MPKRDFGFIGIVSVFLSLTLTHSVNGEEHRLWAMPFEQLATQLSAGELSAEQVVQSYLRRIESIDDAGPTLRARDVASALGIRGHARTFGGHDG